MMFEIKFADLKVVLYFVSCISFYILSGFEKIGTDRKIHVKVGWGGYI
jgi:hypothetical protein